MICLGSDWVWRAMDGVWTGAREDRDDLTTEGQIKRIPACVAVAVTPCLHIDFREVWPMLEKHGCRSGRFFV